MLSDQDLAAILKRSERGAITGLLREDVPKLLEEVKRLRESFSSKIVQRCADEAGRHVASEVVQKALQDHDETARVREARLALAASRAVLLAVKEPALHLADAAKRFDYRARTPEGDTFEHAFGWAREEAARG